MRTSSRILPAVALALTLSSSASAIVHISLTQIGGTYDAAAGVSAGDSLVLQIDYSITDDSMVTAINIALDVGVVATLVGGTETAAALWESGATSAAPIAVPGADITTLNPGHLVGWEKTALAPWGTPGSCIYDTSPGGSCGTLGTVTLALTGVTGVIDTGSILSPIPGGTLIAHAEPGWFCGIPPCDDLGTFSLVPEPTTASLLGLGLLGLTVAGRSRKN